MAQFFRVAQWVLNLEPITHIEVFPSGNGSRVEFSGSKDVRLDKPETDALLEAIQHMKSSPH